jgi:putative hydrolase of the HAD superfamily
MQSDSKKYIKDLLDSLSPIKPLPTGVKPRIKKDQAIRALLFDVYGTLLISSSGDIDETEISETNLKLALDAAGIKIANGKPDALDHILKDYEYTIRICHEAARMNSINYPEIDVLSIWKIVLIHSRRKGLVHFADDADIMLMTCVFEFLSNKVYPMPGLKETVSKLRQLRIPLGIVSNAQFYTPVLMNYYLHDEINLSEKVRGFDQELTVLSYKFGKGKPDSALYEELIPTLSRKYGIKPSEVLFIGNDMVKDIFASKQAGFKTVLFAGDERSLRMREDDKRTANLEPDHIITELPQILTILS